MQELATRHPEDLFVVDALTDIDLAKGRSAQAIARLEKFRTRMPDNEVVVVNLGNAYLEGATTRSPSPFSTPMPASTKRTTWPGACSPMPIARRAG